PQALLAAHEALPLVAHERARQQVRLAQDLEAVADAEHRRACPRRVDDGAHHGCERRDRPGPQVVAVGEPAGHDDRVDALQVVARVPQGDRPGAGGADGAGGVDVVEGPGEGDDPDAGGHFVSSACTLTTSSMTGLDRTVSAAVRAAARCSSFTGPSTVSSNRLPWRTENPDSPWWS